MTPHGDRVKGLGKLHRKMEDPGAGRRLVVEPAMVAVKTRKETHMKDDRDNGADNGLDVVAEDDDVEAHIAERAPDQGVDGVDGRNLAERATD